MSEIRILCIDDNPADISVLRYALDAQGEEYELEVLEDTDDALQFIDEHRSGKREHLPCVILLDIYMPKYDGLDLLRAISQAPPLQHIRVVMTSGRIRPVEADQILALGAVYREKPTELDEYLQFAAEIIAICKSVTAVA